MLANQFFMARKYHDALPLLENSLRKNPTDKGIKRKLIICYNQTDQLLKSAELFYKLISEDIQFVMDADPIKDDCPCPEIIEQLEAGNLIDHNSFESVVHTGILMLYCDYDKTLVLFKRATELSPENILIKDIYNTIKTHSVE